MPIKKFRTFEEASKDNWVMKTDEDYFERLKDYFEFWSKFTQNTNGKGIRKFKNFTESRETVSSKQQTL
jgi:hypothetical protein